MRPGSISNFAPASITLHIEMMGFFKWSANQKRTLHATGAPAVDLNANTANTYSSSVIKFCCASNTCGPTPGCRGRCGAKPRGATCSSLALSMVNLLQVPNGTRSSSALVKFTCAAAAEMEKQKTSSSSVSPVAKW